MVECVKTREIRNAMMKGETLASCSMNPYIHTGTCLGRELVSHTHLSLD